MSVVTVDVIETAVQTLMEKRAVDDYGALVVFDWEFKRCRPALTKRDETYWWGDQRVRVVRGWNVRN